MKMKISVIKFETVNGKKTGKSFVFEEDPEKMARYTTQESLMKALDQEVYRSGIYTQDEMKDLTYSMKEFKEEWQKQVKLQKEAAEKKMLETTEKEYDLDRFLTAQESAYETALAELQEGKKRNHWIWYIFPQNKGLGQSYNSIYYGLEGVGEAKAYLAHPVLSARLEACCKAVLSHPDKDIVSLMGGRIDAMKLKSSMDIFNSASSKTDNIFQKVLETFY